MRLKLAVKDVSISNFLFHDETKVLSSVSGYIKKSVV